MVAQEGSLLPNLSVAENIFLGHEQQFIRFGMIDWRLSFGERQMVELARVLGLQNRTDGRALIILDEPHLGLERSEGGAPLRHHA
jgi:ribose transport system ATP-binding protein